MLSVASNQSEQVLVLELVAQSTIRIPEGVELRVVLSLVLLLYHNRIALVDELLPLYSLLVKRVEVLVHVLGDLLRLLV